MRNILMVLALALAATACTNSGGGGGVPPVNPGPPILLGPSYPSVSKSTYESTKSVLKEGEETIVTLTIRDQFGNPLNISGKWTLAIMVSCDECSDDPTVASVPSSDPTQRKYRFTPTESKAHSVVVLFNPTITYSANCSKPQHYTQSNCLSAGGRWVDKSAFDLDFPKGIPEEELYAVGTTIPEFDVCMLAAQEELNGLRGTLEIGGKERMAICSADDLALVAGNSYFLDKNLYLAKDIDLAPYYAANKPEFAIADKCDEDGFCDYFTGDFYGNFKTIAGFKRSNGLGLFGFLMYEGQVEYLTLANTVQTGTSGGAIASIVAGRARITGVKVSGSVTGTENVGGLIGEMYDGYILSSHSTATVISNKVAGGLLGYGAQDDSINFNQISSSSANGSVVVQNVPSGETGYAGGLIGAADTDTRIYNSFFDGSVTSPDVVGGIAGSFYGLANNVYVNGSLSGASVGGIFGRSAVRTAPEVNTINNSFVNISISGQDQAGISIECNSLTVQGFFHNSPAVACVTSSNFQSSSVSQATVNSISELLSAVQPIVNNWPATTWKFSNSALPKNN